MSEKGILKTKIARIKDNIYLIIPMCCIVLWAIIFLISSLFDPTLTDFRFIYFDFEIWYDDVYINIYSDY